MSPTPQALTIQAPLTSNLGARIVIGSTQLSLDQSKNNLYWIVVLDRQTLDVKLNISFSENDTVPTQLGPFIGNSNYILILTTQTLNTANIPTGAFYKYLVNEGAGPELNRMEQIFASLNCGNWAWFAYTYVAVMCDDSSDGFEMFDFTNSTIMTLSLKPISIGGKNYYTPVSQL